MTSKPGRSRLLRAPACGRCGRRVLRLLVWWLQRVWDISARVMGMRRACWPVVHVEWVGFDALDAGCWVSLLWSVLR